MIAWPTFRLLVPSTKLQSDQTLERTIHIPAWSRWRLGSDVDGSPEDFDDACLVDSTRFVIQRREWRSCRWNYFSRWPVFWWISTTKDSGHLFFISGGAFLSCRRENILGNESIDGTVYERFRLWIEWEHGRSGLVRWSSSTQDVLGIQSRKQLLQMQADPPPDRTSAWWERFTGHGKP